MGRENGSSLAYVDPNSGHAIIKVDNTTFVPFNQKRNSVRFTPSPYYPARLMLL